MLHENHSSMTFPPYIEKPSRFVAKVKSKSLACLMQLLPHLELAHKMKRHEHVTVLPLAMGVIKQDCKGSDSKRARGFFMFSGDGARDNVRAGTRCAILDETDEEFLLMIPGYSAPKTVMLFAPGFLWIMLKHRFTPSLCILILEYIPQFSASVKAWSRWIKKEEVESFPMVITLNAELGTLEIKCRRAFRWTNHQLFLRHTIRNPRPGNRER